MTENGGADYHFYQIASVNDIPEGERLFFEIDGQQIVLFAINGEFLATGDVCTHDGGPVGEGELAGEEIICPRHGARFNIRTGKVLSMPAVSDIPVFPVRIRNGNIEVGVPTVG
jgi:3-phenylpropionate/trans-cinnamate dioxygenase ferredoxin subunit